MSNENFSGCIAPPMYHLTACNDTSCTTLLAETCHKNSLSSQIAPCKHKKKLLLVFDWQFIDILSHASALCATIGCVDLAQLKYVQSS